MEDIKKIIIDTDVGDDIDDAFALALAINHKNINLLGITTVYKNVAERAKIVKSILKAYNRQDIGVYAGEDFPLKQNLLCHQKEEQYANGTYKITQCLDEMQQEEYNECSAVDFILEQAEKYPNEIVLVAIGPLTNLAKAYIKNKLAFLKLKSLLIMGGAYNSFRKEWNIRCDPESASVVVASGIDIQFVGVDITEKALLKEKDVCYVQTKNTKGAKLISKMQDVWIDRNTQKIPTMHDGLTLSCLIDNVCEFVKTKAYVGIDENDRASFIFNENDIRAKEIQFAVSADYERAIKLILNYI